MKSKSCLQCNLHYPKLNFPNPETLQSRSECRGLCRVTNGMGTSQVKTGLCLETTIHWNQGSSQNNTAILPFPTLSITNWKQCASEGQCLNQIGGVKQVYPGMLWLSFLKESSSILMHNLYSIAMVKTIFVPVFKTRLRKIWYRYIDTHKDEGV